MDYERERRRKKRYREAMRNRIIAAVLLAGIIVGAIFIIKGCKKDDAPVDEDQNQPAQDVLEPVDDQPKVDDELLTLVNPWNPLPDSWTPDLVTLSDGRKIDSRCYEAFEEMMDACKAAGYSPFLCSAYRTQETQQSLYDNKVQRLISSGMGEEEAKVEAAKAVAIPGTSEHQLGLAVDIVDANMQDLTTSRRTPPPRSGSWPTPGGTGSFTAIPTTRPISPASSTSRGTTAMWVRTRRRISSTGISRWRSILARRSTDAYNKERSLAAPLFI